MILRPYQQEAVKAIKGALNRKKTCLLSAPCAAGKTVIFSEIAKWLRENDRRVLVLMDRENLVSQTARRLEEYMDCGVGIACATASSVRDLSKRVVVASRQTLAPMLRNGHKDTIFNCTILDEAHLVGRTGQYSDILAQLWANYEPMRVLGCTATPYRLKGGMIYGEGQLFDCLDHKITFSELLEQGYLSPLRWKIRQTDLNAQLDNVHKSSTGELNETEQYAVLGQSRFVEGVYDSWRDHAGDRRAVVFALNIAHAEAIGEVFRSKGIMAMVIHSKLPTDEIRAKIEAFRSGNCVLINVGILTIGSDIPEISCIILARRTLSTSLFFQIVGRGARLSPGKNDCLIIDLCGNSLIHNTDPDNPFIQMSEDNDRDREPEIKICPMCEEGIGRNAKVCPKCGFEFPVAEKNEEPEPEPEERDVALTEFKGFPTIPCYDIRYKRHQAFGKLVPSVCAEYYDADGKLIARQWLCPEHEGFPKKKARFYWRDMGGEGRAPRDVEEYLRRCGELSKGALVTVDFNKKWPEIRRVAAYDG